jgi:hypothetical protein
MALKIAQFAAVLLVGILAGLLVGVWFVEQAMLSLSASVYTAVEIPKHRIFGPVMPWLMGVALTAGSLVLLLLRPRIPVTFALTLAAVLCTAIIITTTLLVNVPINADMMTNWSASAPPTNWAQVRDRWNLFHAIRTVLALVAFGCHLSAAILVPSKRVATPPPVALAPPTTVR